MNNQADSGNRPSRRGRRGAAVRGLEQRFALRWRSLGERGRLPIVVGFSGGIDSLALAALFSRTTGSAEMLLVHVDHRLRPESAAEAAEAGRLATELGLKCEVVRLAADLKLRHPGVGIEEAARRERYSALVNAASRAGTDLIATGHHRDDQAETVLLHLLRGAGISGARGMRELAGIQIPWWESSAAHSRSYRIWRPLLGEAKETLIAYLDQLDLRPIDDATNRSAAFARNRIRHELMPTVELIMPGAADALVRFAGIAGSEDQLLHELAREALARCRTELGLRVATLKGEHPALQRRVLRQWLIEYVGRQEIGLERVDALLRLSGVDAGATVELGGGIVCTVLGGILVAGSPTQILDHAWSCFPGPRVDAERDSERALPSSGEIRIGDISICREPDWAGDDDDRRRRMVIDEDAARNLRIRRLRPGDRFISGGDARDWLRACGVPVQLRDKLVCVVNDAGVVWIPGCPNPGAGSRRTGAVLCWKPAEKDGSEGGEP